MLSQTTNTDFQSFNYVSNENNGVISLGYQYLVYYIQHNNNNNCSSAFPRSSSDITRSAARFLCSGGLPGVMVTPTIFPFLSIVSIFLPKSLGILYTRVKNNNKIIIIIIIPRQCLWCCHHGTAIARVHPVHLMNVERRQAAADPRPSQTT